MILQISHLERDLSVIVIYKIMIEFTEREIRIISAALDRGKENVFSPIVSRQTKVNNAFGIGFIEGALWADEHPKSPWIRAKDQLPPVDEKDISEQSEPVLVKISGHCEPEILVYNKYYHVWDTSDGDDYSCNISDDDLWMPIPSFDEILEANRDVLERIKEKGD